MTTPILWQFTFSHFNEKARWALDYKGVRHRRHTLPPGLHLPPVLFFTGQRSLPVLQEGGRLIADSTRILEHLERTSPHPPLYPEDPALRRRAADLEDYWDEELAPHLRRVLMDAVLRDADYTARVFGRDAFGFGGLFYRAFFPGVSLALKSNLDLDPSAVAHSRAKLEAALDRIAAELGPSGYLAGDGFTVADLAAAALVSPILQPPELQYPAPRPYSTAVDELFGRYRRHPAMEWAAGVYARHRGVSAEARA